MNDWIKRWLFAISLTLAILMPISTLLIGTLARSSPQQTFSLPITVFGLMVVLVIVFLLVALGAIITWQTQRNPWVKAKYYGLVILTLAFDAICWLVIWSLYQTVT
jgi:hypothetical protein